MSDRDLRLLTMYWGVYKRAKKKYQDERNSVKYRNLARTKMIDYGEAIKRKQRKLGLREAWFSIPPPIEGDV